MIPVSSFFTIYLKLQERVFNRTSEENALCPPNLGDCNGLVSGMCPKNKDKRLGEMDCRSRVEERFGKSLHSSVCEK